MTVITVLHSADVVHLYPRVMFPCGNRRTSYGALPGKYRIAFPLDQSLVPQHMPTRTLNQDAKPYPYHINLVNGTVLLGLSLHEPVLICDIQALTIKGERVITTNHHHHTTNIPNLLRTYPRVQHQ
uniref:Uncharacterized protein n=1 Tax=Arundo donax TaxID=35708 RepID=A0A0A9BVJ3_ARUDO